MIYFGLVVGNSILIILRKQDLIKFLDQKQTNGDQQTDAADYAKTT